MRGLLIWAVVSLIGLTIYLNSALQPKSIVKINLLKWVPIGTEKKEVLNYLERKTIIDSNYYGNIGWSRNYPYDSIIGNSTIQATLDEFGPINITTIWIFDKNDKLIDVIVWRTIDLL